MPKVTLKSLRDDVLRAARAVAEENENLLDDAVPPEGTLIVATEADRKLWLAARRLRRWEDAKKQ